MLSWDDFVTKVQTQLTNLCVKDFYDRIVGEIATTRTKCIFCFVIGTIFGQGDYNWMGLSAGTIIAMILISLVFNKTEDTKAKNKTHQVKEENNEKGKSQYPKVLICFQKSDQLMLELDMLSDKKFEEVKQVVCNKALQIQSNSIKYGRCFLIVTQEDDKKLIIKGINLTEIAAKEFRTLLKEDVISYILDEELLPKDSPNAVKHFNPESDKADEEQNTPSQTREDSEFLEKDNQEGQDSLLNTEIKQLLSQSPTEKQPDGDIDNTQKKNCWSANF